MLRNRLHWRPLAFAGIVLIGLCLRLYGINWDQGNNLHPDERQILFHVMALQWPTSLAQFLDSTTSPLNPHFFAYGSFPLYLLAFIGGAFTRFIPALSSFSGYTLIGRVLSALFDTGTIALTGWLALALLPTSRFERVQGWNLALLASGLVAFTPLQLQLSHFYAVDTLLLFFVCLTLLAAIKLAETRAPIRWSLIAGLGFGLALATKTSAAPLAVPLLIALWLCWRSRGYEEALGPLLLEIVSTLFVFLIAMPYALMDFRNFWAQVSEQGSMARGQLDFPYVRQFAGTVPFVYEGWNMLLWGLGLMLGLVAFAGLGWFGWRIWKRKADLWLIPLSWIVIYFLLTGSFYVKFMRYMLPLYPFLSLIAAAFLLMLLRSEWFKNGRREDWHKQVRRYLPQVFVGLVVGGTIFQGLALLNVYSQPNTRVQASEWMYNHLAQGSVLTYEQWDDPLPVPTGSKDPSLFAQLPTGNGGSGLDLYGDDTPEKARLLAAELTQVNVLTMASDRLDKSIPRLPDRYPLTIRYYNLLFHNQLGFRLAATFEQRPSFLGVTLDDSGADESYSVFDHPRVRIFVRDHTYSSEELYQRLITGVNFPTAQRTPSARHLSPLLSEQQQQDNQDQPPLAQQLPLSNLPGGIAVLWWWVILLLLSVAVYPFLWWLLRSLPDRGYSLSKTIGMLALAYPVWLLASLRLLPFSGVTLWGICLALLLCSGSFFFLKRRAIIEYIRERWRLLLIEELLFTLAFLFFVGIRSLNPDLWNPYIGGGEKPMELAFIPGMPVGILITITMVM